MNKLNARPQMLKQANLTLIRKMIREMGTATRAELAAATKISSTTVRSLLSEMLDSGEIENIGQDSSSGGRRAERYGLVHDMYYGAAFCITDSTLHRLLVNVCGEVVEKSQIELAGEDDVQEIIACLDSLMEHKNIRAIGIGVPGIVDGDGYYRKSRHGDELIRLDIGERIAERYSIPLVMENDLNATAIGVGYCYERSFPSESRENTNMAYLHFEDGCVSAGIIANGKIVRGCNNFAGELGLIPVSDNKLLDERMYEPMNDCEYVGLAVQVASWICGVLNPQYIALGGPGLRKDCVGPIGDGLVALLPKGMAAEILYTPDLWHDYYEGIAQLTAARMFDDVRLVRE